MPVAPPASKLKLYGSLIRFSHTVFALPFALSMAIVASKFVPITLIQISAILLCLVSARTAAMTFNRIIDRRIDAENPRTKEREIPAGKVSLFEAKVLLSLSSLVFLWGAWLLGVHCLVAAPLVLGILFFYSWTKRFTSFSHFVLGICLSLAPGGVWYALTAQVAWLPVYLMLAVALWVAGFDILYSCQDEEFDRKAALFSVPAKVGREKAFLAAKLCHLTSAAFLFIFGWLAGLGSIYFAGTAIFGLIVASQYFIISPRDISRINAAFFGSNGLAGFFYLAVVVADRLL